MNGLSSVGGWELLLIAIVAIFVLGPERMIRYAFQSGRLFKKLSLYWKVGVNGFREELKNIDDISNREFNSIRNIGQLDRESDVFDDNIMGNTDKIGIDSNNTSEQVESAPSKTYSAWINNDEGK